MFMNPVHCLPASLCTCALLSATAASLHAETAYSTPCGYIQTDLYAKATNYLGLGVHPEALVQHTLQADHVTVEMSTVTITEPDASVVDFNEIMSDTASAYILVLNFEKESIAIPLNRNGWKRPEPCWNQSTITIRDSSLASVIKNKKPDSYIIRKARTVNDMLGNNNKFGLASGVPNRADSISIFSTPTTNQDIYFNGTQWTRKGSRENVGNMPVFSHEPLGITRRKSGDPIQSFVVGEVSTQHQKLLLSSDSTLVHMRVPLSHTLRNSGLTDAAVSCVYAPLGQNNAMVKCNLEGSEWKREDNSANVSDIPLEGPLIILYGQRIPAYITINSPVSTNP